MPTIIFNGRTYDSMDETPAEARQAYEQVASMPPAKPLLSQEYNPAIQEEAGSNTMVWVMLGLGLFVCLALAAAGLFVLIRSS